MSKICGIYGCNSRYTRNVSFFSFPRNKNVYEKWLNVCNQTTSFERLKDKRICSKHFTFEDFEDGIKASILNRRPKRLKENVVPSLYLSNNIVDTRQNLDVGDGSQLMNDSFIHSETFIPKMEKMEEKPLVGNDDILADSLENCSYCATSELKLKLANDQINFLINEHTKVQAKLNDKIFFLEKENDLLKNTIHNLETTYEPKFEEIYLAEGN